MLTPARERAVETMAETFVATRPSLNAGPFPACIQVFTFKASFAQTDLAAKILSELFQKNGLEPLTTLSQPPPHAGGRQKNIAFAFPREHIDAVRKTGADIANMLRHDPEKIIGLIKPAEAEPAPLPLRSKAFGVPAYDIKAGRHAVGEGAVLRSKNYVSKSQALKGPR